mgnify:CR=1 FL=1
MIKIVNYCKPGGMNLLGIPGAFDDEIEGELLPCPLCGRIPKPMVRVSSTDGYLAAVSCFGGKGVAHTYVSARGQDAYLKVLDKAINEWNNGTIEVYEDRKRTEHRRTPS